MHESYPVSVDQRGGRFHERQSILEVAFSVRPDGLLGERANALDRIKIRLEAIICQMTKPGDLEQTSLESNISSKGRVEERSPDLIVQVMIDCRCDIGRDGATHIVPLHQPTARDEFGKAVTHPITKGRHARERRQLQRHEISKVNGMEAPQEPPERSPDDKDERDRTAPLDRLPVSSTNWVWHLKNLFAQV
jgi:hypothetical protein